MVVPVLPYRPLDMDQLILGQNIVFSKIQNCKYLKKHQEKTGKIVVSKNHKNFSSANFREICDLFDNSQKKIETCQKPLEKSFG